MMLKKFAAAAGTFAAITLGATASFAQSTTIPGEQVGLAVGAPLPEGIYAIDTFIYRRNDTRFSTDTAINVPVLVWSTGFKLFGANVQPLLAQPTVFGFPNNPGGLPNRDFSVNVGTLVGSIFAWDLGNNFGVSYLFGGYLPIETRFLTQTASLSHRFAASYTGDGLNLTANLLYGIFLDPVSPQGGVYPDYLNLDLTATRTFGTWEVGPVAFASTDLPTRFPGYQRQGQIAVGGLIGYNFGPVNLQAYVTQDVVERRYGGRETRGWLRVIVPIYKESTNAAAPTRPVAGPGRFAGR